MPGTTLGWVGAALSPCKITKPGSGLANIVVQAGYDLTWNKLASIFDPIGNETDFTYYPAGHSGASLMEEALRPANSSNSSI
jgi:hypothetical protein